MDTQLLDKEHKLTERRVASLPHGLLSLSWTDSLLSGQSAWGVVVPPSVSWTDSLISLNVTLTSSTTGHRRVLNFPLNLAIVHSKPSPNVAEWPVKPSQNVRTGPWRLSSSLSIIHVLLVKSFYEKKRTYAHKVAAQPIKKVAMNVNQPSKIPIDHTLETCPKFKTAIKLMTTSLSNRSFCENTI